ncbi:MAG: MFS transporter [Polyangiaceae bacterium]
MNRDREIGERIDSTIPGRLDALAWSPWHSRVVLALGITWILDGLEASLVANLGPTLQDSRTLGLTSTQVGLASSVYLVGQVLGALVFGHLTDRSGRKKLFLVTLALYLAATAASGLSPTFSIFLVFRFLAGAGIGGEYSAINSAIDELVPARLRGRIDLAINGSYWIGVGAGAVLTLFLLDPARVPPAFGWRIAFGFGSILGLAILFVRRDVPESPRWLLMHGYEAEAERTMTLIEQHAGVQRRKSASEGDAAITDETPKMTAVSVTGTVGFRHVFRTLFVKHRKRAVLALALMLAQSFLYNAIFFSYGLILQNFHHVRADRVGLYMIPFAVGNFLGPLLLGPLFDRWGRRIMIPATYALSGILLTATGALFVLGKLDAISQTASWCFVFFFASSAASSAYLTVSELFPIELRGMVIAVFYAAATSIGAFAPSLFGRIAGDKSPVPLFEGYVFASVLMIGAAIIARVYGVDSENKSLEELNAA